MFNTVPYQDPGGNAVLSLMLEKLSGILSDTCKNSGKGTNTTQLSHNDILILYDSG